MRGLLATAYASGFAFFMWLARRAMRRSERHAERAGWCKTRANNLESPPPKPQPGDKPHE